MEERFIERRFEAIDKRQAAQEDLLTKIFGETARANTDIGVLKHDSGTLKTEMEGARADITALRESQADLRDTLKDHTKRFERIESTMGTKDDIAALKTTQDEHSQKLDEHGDLLRQILERLPAKPPEG